MANQEKNYSEIISKLVKKQSFLDKTLLHNLLSHDCEQIFNLTCEIDVDNFIHLYGRQSFDYCVKQSNFWLGGENYYDNIKNKSLCCSHEIIPINITNIDKILYERISIYASTIECDYLELKNKGFFQEWFNETKFSKEFYTQNKEYICNLINRELKQSFISYNTIDWGFVSQYAPINILELCLEKLYWGNVLFNPNVTTEFVLKYINYIGITYIVWRILSNNSHSNIDLDDIPRKYLKNINKQHFTLLIIKNSDEILNNESKLDNLEKIAEFIDWDKLLSSVKMSQEFILRFYKYWGKDNPIVKSITNFYK